MGISKKYIRESFKEAGIQLNADALHIIEDRLKGIVIEIVGGCTQREFKRVTPDRLKRMLKYEDLV